MTDGNVDESTTDGLLENRQAVYGPRVENMEQVAQLWSVLLGKGREIADWEVPLLMSAYKMFRTFRQPDYSDNSDDIDGWKKMFVEVMDANHGGIVQARTVEEYKRKKNVVHLSEGEQLATHATASFERPALRLVEGEDGQVAYAKVAPTRAENGLPLPPQSEGKMLDEWSRHRCGYRRDPKDSFCMLAYGHAGECDPRG